VLARHLSVVALVCCAFAATAVPAGAHTKDTDAVLLAHTLADGFTAIDAHRPQARAAVGDWLAAQGRCAKPHLRARSRRSRFTALRWQALHAVALKALAPDLERLTDNLRALPVKTRAVRGGIQEVLLDYRHARELIDATTPNLCRLLQRVRADKAIALPPGTVEDVRPSPKALGRRSARLRAAQDALLAVEVDPRLARSLDTVFEHATAGLYRSRLNVRERLAPPFPIVTDAARLERLRAEAASVAAAAGRLRTAQDDASDHLERAVRRVERCLPALKEGAERRPVGVGTLELEWILGEVAAATRPAVKRFRADLAATQVTDPALRDLLARVTDELTGFSGIPRTNLCSKLRAWRRADWRRGAVHVPGSLVRFDTEGESFSGIRLEDEVIDRAVLKRRGVSRAAAAALLDPLGTLLAGVETEQASAAAAARLLGAARGA
jgi:hypothetical protein